MSIPLRERFWRFWDKYYFWDHKGFQILVTTMIFLAFFWSICSIVCYMDSTIRIAQVEQMQDDVYTCPMEMNEGVLRTASEVNLQIAKAKECNRHWWCDLSESDKWNDVEFIKYPTQEEIFE